jgi:hypothetical protein
MAAGSAPERIAIVALDLSRLLELRV